MTTEYITKGNRLIAIEMGAKEQIKPDFFDPDRMNTSYIYQGHPGNWRVDIKTKSHMTLPMLCYHTDWEWLMPVVEHIEAMGYTVSISNNTCFISKVNKYEPYVTRSTKLEAAYTAIVEFFDKNKI